MEGLIIKILRDKCLVKIDEEEVLCTIRGRIRSQKLFPMVGDKVVINYQEKIIEKILPRKNEIIRPPVSNITQGIIVASLKEPMLDTNLIDKILVELEFNRIKPIICFTKIDLLSEQEKENIKKLITYYRSLYPVYFNNDITNLKKVFANEITVFIGQSGSGKSTLLNKLDSHLKREVGEISQALGRGRHTTRHVELFFLLGGMILDTPGFSSLSFANMMEVEIRDAFIEFSKYPCPYRDCMHTKEEDCMVKQAVKENKILLSRYQNYLSFLKTGINAEYKRRSNS